MTEQESLIEQIIHKGEQLGFEKAATDRRWVQAFVLGIASSFPQRTTAQSSALAEIEPLLTGDSDQPNVKIFDELWDESETLDEGRQCVTRLLIAGLQGDVQHRNILFEDLIEYSVCAGFGHDFILRRMSKSKLLLT